jgi:hypothetical protein
MLSQSLWIMVCYFAPVMVDHVVLFWDSHWLEIIASYADPMVVNHCALSCVSGCESCCVMLHQWLWITICYSEPVVLNDGVLFWANGCESCVILGQWFWIMVIDAQPVVVNAGVLFWTSGCESWYVILRQLLCIMVNYPWPWVWIVGCYAELMVVNHDLS